MDSLYVELAKLGLAGLFIGYLIKENWDLRRENGALHLRIDTLQDKRVGEVTESVKALGSAAAAGEKMAEVMDRLSESVQNQTVAFNELADNVSRIDPEVGRRPRR